MVFTSWLLRSAASTGGSADRGLARVRLQAADRPEQIYLNHLVRET